MPPIVEDSAVGEFILKSQGYKERSPALWPVALLISLIVLAILLGFTGKASAFITECSYYTSASCAREGTSGIMANRERLRDEGRYTAASWDYRFGTMLKVRNLRNNREIVVCVADRGPAKRLYKVGRRLDLNLAAAEALGFVKEGITQVEVTEEGR